MTTDKEDEFMEQMIAKHDAWMTVAREATQVLEGSIMEHKVMEEDFLRSSG
jgi:hypothetical protein